MFSVPPKRQSLHCEQFNKRTLLVLTKNLLNLSPGNRYNSLVPFYHKLRSSKSKPLPKASSPKMSNGQNYFSGLFRNKLYTSKLSLKQPVKLDSELKIKAPSGKAIIFQDRPIRKVDHSFEHQIRNTSKFTRINPGSISEMQCKSLKISETPIPNNHIVINNYSFSSSSSDNLNPIFSLDNQN